MHGRETTDIALAAGAVPLWCMCRTCQRIVPPVLASSTWTVPTDPRGPQLPAMIFVGVGRTPTTSTCSRGFVDHPNGPAYALQDVPHHNWRYRTHDWLRQPGTEHPSHSRHGICDDDSTFGLEPCGRRSSGGSDSHGDEELGLFWVKLHASTVEGMSELFDVDAVDLMHWLTASNPSPATPRNDS